VSKVIIDKRESVRMTRIAVPNETGPTDKRTAMTPDNVGKLTQVGAEVLVESGLGLGCGFPDEHYQKAGARVTGNRRELYEAADIVLRIHKPEAVDIPLLKKGVIHISYLDPFFEQDLVEVLRDQMISAISMEMIPRTTRAQKMDALSSQAKGVE